MLPPYRSTKHENGWLPQQTKLSDTVRSWLKLITSDSRARSILLFLVINLSFAFIELIWGMWSNSLSLISDSFHMFFDCTGLLCGLVASLITKWKPNEKFTYGYVRAEILAGFINGLFLLFIAFFIFSEAFERAFEPPEVHHDRLMVVSVVGLLINILGIFVFHGHVHGHSHGASGGGSHSHHGHSHDHHSHGISPKPTKNGYLLMDQQDSSPLHVNLNIDDDHSSHHHNHGDSTNFSNHGHSHSHNNNVGESDVIPSSDNQIMKGVFLHVLADTLGSVGVIISAILMKMFGWMIADPICSMIIAGLITASVLPLIKESACILMMRSPSSLDNLLNGCYQKIMCLEGVLSIQEPHFWTLCSDVHVGMLKLEVSPRCDPRYVTNAAQSILKQVGLKHAYIQLDFAPA